MGVPQLISSEQLTAQSHRHHTTFIILTMSAGLRIKDVLSMVRQNKLDRTLGLVEAPTQFRQSNPKLPQNDPSYSYLRSERKHYEESFVNAARTEQGVTYYTSQANYFQ